jgi:Putative glutamine amidotransferase
MSGWHLSFLPHLPWPLFWALAGLGIVAIAAMLIGRMRGAWLRGIGLALLLGAVANPQLLQDEREHLPDVAVIIIDESESQDLADRRAVTEAAVEGVKQRLTALGNTDIRIGRSVPGTTPDTDGTRVFTALQRIMADVPPERFAGAVIISDGQVHDVPTGTALAQLRGPIHSLISGKRGEIDRRIVIEAAPRFAITGREDQLTFRVDETPASSVPVPVTVRLPDGTVQNLSLVPGASETLVFRIERAGQNVVQFEAATRDNEITIANNKAVVVIEGIRDRLRVLLVSGEPHPGERTWRNMLKADAAVDLVHFTILRPPEKQDGTPTKELSLIAFPTRELFIDKIDEFDLVIFDRYQRQSILPDNYMANIADYVRRGGAVLVSSGPDFAQFDGLANTPLSDVLAALPSGVVVEQGFKPLLTTMGQRHPVTRALPGDAGETPNWGRWFRMIDTAVNDTGQTLMHGPDDKPLLVLARAGEGRVAQFLSDHGWLWARGFEGGGPQVELLRRTAHWLMKEPDLEEEALIARQEGRDLVVERRTLADTAGDVTVTLPSGKNLAVPLSPSRPGIFSAVVPSDETGLHTIADGTFTSFAVMGNADQREFTDVLATDKVLGPIATATRGGVFWLEDGLPRISKARSGGVMAGAGYLQLTDNNQVRVLAVKETPLFSTLASLAVMLLALSLMWYREGR